MDWGGPEAQGSIQSLTDWLKEQNNEHLLFICFGASIMSTTPLCLEHPIIAFDPIYTPEQLIQTYPELSKKTHHFWKERELSDTFLREITILSSNSKSFREKLLRRQVLLRKTFY